MKKLEIVMFYFVFVSLVTLFWAVLFKLLCPMLILGGTLFVFIATTIISMVLLTRCLIDLDRENELIVDSLENIYD